MKKFLVIGNPIEHSLSPMLHNYWINENNINALYEKHKLVENDLKDLILQIKDNVYKSTPGNYCESVIPDPIPNSEVKPFSANGTLS